MKNALLTRIITGLFLVFLIQSCGSDKLEVRLPSHSEDSSKYVVPTTSDADLATRIDSFFSARSKARKFNGAVLFAKDGEILHKGAYGYADIPQKDTLSTHSSFQLASISKPITALGICLLVDNDLLSFDDSVSEYISNFPYEGLTIRMLLSHRSGLSNYMYFSDEYWPNKKTYIGNEDVVCLMEENCPKPYLKPNTKYNYSNTNYMLLAKIVENVTGEYFEDFIQKHIFDKLEMYDSFVYNGVRHPQQDSLGVKGHYGSGKYFHWFYQNGVVGDKGAYSSVEDMFKLDQALYTSSLVSKKTLKEAFTPQTEKLRGGVYYGLGWRVDLSGDDKIIYHTGWWNGFRTYFYRVLNNKYTVIVLTNRLSGGFLHKNQLLNLVRE